MFERVRRFQEFLVESGFSRNVLALPAPKTLLIEDFSAKDEAGTVVFARTVVEPEIVEVSRDLFASGHYNLAVHNAFKAVDNFVRTKSGSGQSGTSGMRVAFNNKEPKLVWSDRTNDAERDEQEGYSHIFAGAMLGIRNPVTHEFGWVSDEQTALELLVVAQHLLRKAKVAYRP
ncbi:TIGR02391 family protein [Tateyamaria omphalii]|uniref:TIGR02391 family protein n=1 Tax=Tateyamaria omphalii TaxID=299262 RepID=A0A1P8MSG3_9RHOB|nr:TIGR02391 family protein [Tateyamaria omphalii]APX11020.1 TIGR02391 family protein [Tateyamaria omphalii]